MGTDTPKRRRKGIDFRNFTPGLFIGLLDAEPDFSPLRDQPDPTPYIATIEATGLARRSLGLLNGPVGRGYSLIAHRFMPFQ
jgi:hypothetical protein